MILVWRTIKSFEKRISEKQFTCYVISRVTHIKFGIKMAGHRLRYKIKVSRKINVLRTVICFPNPLFSLDLVRKTKFSLSKEKANDFVFLILNERRELISRLLPNRQKSKNHTITVLMEKLEKALLSNNKIERWEEALISNYKKVRW